MLPNSDVLAQCQHFDPQIWSDLYKDAMGFRPRFDLSDYSASDLDRLWNDTCVALDETMEREKIAHADALVRFNQRIERMVTEYGAQDRDQAMRWISQAEGCEGDYEHLLWGQGIAFEDMIHFGVKVY